MRFRVSRSVALIPALLLTLTITLDSPGVVSAAHSAGTLLFTAVPSRDVASGGVARVWVHTMALARVTLKVDYGNGQVVIRQASTDSRGTYLFQWTARYTGTRVVLARYWVYVTRGDRSTAARGNFVLFPAPPLSVRLEVLTPRIYVGDQLRLRVHSRPQTALSLSVQAEDGRRLATQSAQTDANGYWVGSIPVSATIAQSHQLHVVVVGQSLGRRASDTQYFTLTPAPPSQVSLLAGIPIPAARGASLDETRRLARAAAGGSYTVALTNARAATQAITVDLQVLSQWTRDIPTHDAAYYAALLDRARTYDDLIAVTAQDLADDNAVEARMREVMPHRAIMVSIGEQVLRAYQDGQLVMSTYVTTGRPELPTVTGHFAIYEKVTPFEFISPWPVGSPYYYAPTWIKYWMPFYSGYGLHDAWWRAHYGPGTNIYGDGPGSSEPTGTHGCVNIPFDKTQWLWDWAPVGTPVVVYGGPSVKPGAAGI